MNPYTASEAIAPAWQHAKSLLFRDRRLGRMLKLSLVALGAQLSFSFNSNFRGMSGLPHGMQTMLIGLGVLISAISVVVGVGLLYLGSRLQLTLFDIVLLRDDRVAPAWERHGHHTWRWAGIKVAGMLAIGIVLSPLLVPAFAGMFSLLHRMTPMPGQTPPAPMFLWPAVRALLVVTAQLVAVLLLFSIFYRLLLTLTLPVLALENLSFGDVFRRAWQFLIAEPGAMAAYAGLQFLLFVGLGIAALFAWALAIVLPAAVIGLLGWALWALLHGSLAGSFVLGALGFFAGVVLLAWTLLTYLMMVGFTIVFAEAYAQYFIAGRYAPVALYLQPEPAQPEPILGFRD